MSKTLFVFLDESGNLDFSPKGTKYFVLTAVSTLTPVADRSELTKIKYALLKRGINQEYFHATEDKQIVRDAVFNVIKKSSDYEVDSIVVQKNKTNPALFVGSGAGKVLRVEEKFYKMVCENLLKYIIKRYWVLKGSGVEVDKVVCVLDALFTKNKQEYDTKYLKQYFKSSFSKVPYVYFHQVKSDLNCQVADYCGWAIYVKWEKSEFRPYKEIYSKIRSEFDIFGIGTKTYY